jgi:hypothetical protein
MVQTGIASKEQNSLSKKIRSYFERVRVAYLSARDSPREFKSKWAKAVDDIKGQWDDTDELARTFKKYLDEETLFHKEVKNPESIHAERVYESIKRMRYSFVSNDPFIKKHGKELFSELLKDSTLFAQFIHWATRNTKFAVKKELWIKNNLQPDEISEGWSGLDLQSDDLVAFISTHYGDDEDSSRLKGKFNGAMKLLNKVMGEDELKEVLEIQKAEKSEVHFLVPNKPMYRIFDVDDIEELKGFTGEWLVQEKYDGMRVQIHKIDNNVKIYSFNEKDITAKCSDQVDLMKKAHFGDCILDAELMLFDGDEPLHRAEVVAKIFKGKESDTELRCHVFDIMRHNDEDITNNTLEERIKTLFNNYTQHSHEKLAFPSKKDTRFADNLKDVEKYAKEIMKIPTSEGVIIKDLTSTYFVGTKKNPKWIKWKKFVDLDLIVLDVKETKSDMFNYLLGAGPLTDEEAKTLPVSTYENTNYTPVGRSVNTKIEEKVGTILRVKVDEVKHSKKGYKLFNAKVIEIPEVEHPDKIVTLKLLSADTKKSVSYKVEALTKGIVVTDYVHGEAIIKSDLDGFIRFQTNNLMSKNALLDIDLWKEQFEEVTKRDKGELRTHILHYLEREGEKSIQDIEKYIIKDEKFAKFYDNLFDSNIRQLENYMVNQAGSKGETKAFFVSTGNHRFRAEKNIIAKYKTPDEIRHAQFKLYMREDGNLQLLIKSNKLIAWTIKINSVDDVFNLFGKSKRFPAKIESNISKDKSIDGGKVELGVQRHGYHEYMLKGNKFNSKLHLKVLPVKGDKYWLAFTDTKNKPIDESSDEGIWDINLDKYKSLSFDGLE